MANVEHSTLTGSALHEPKGIAAAAANRVYVSNGAASGSWTTVPNAALSTEAKAFQGGLLHVSHVVAGNAGTATSGSFLARPLNTVLTNEISGASVASNQITLPVGTYYADIRATFSSTNGTQIRLQNLTDGTTTLNGSVHYIAAQTSGTTMDMSTDVCVKGRFTIGATKVFEVQYRAERTETTSGLGRAGFGGNINHADVCIWKVG